MNFLKFCWVSSLGWARVCGGQGILMVILGLSPLSAGASPGVDPVSQENDQAPPSIALIETNVEMSGDRQGQQRIIITEENLPPLPHTESTADLLLPKNPSEIPDPTRFLLSEDNTEVSETESGIDTPVDDSQTAADNPWTFKFQPYATLPLSTYGNSTVRGREIDYHLNLGQLLDILKVAASGRVEAWYKDLGFIVDGYYVNLGGGGIVSFKNLPNTTIESQLTVQQGIYDFAVSYRFGDTPPNRLPDQPSKKNYPLFWFEPYAGTRLNDIQAELEDFTLRVGNSSISADFDRIKETQGRTWFEPLLGGKLGIQISDPIAFWLRGDASGFGLAGDTDLSWQVLGGIDWWVNHSIALQLGYRFYEINYQNGSGNEAFGLNMNLNGPFIAATFYF
ncbi:MAG: hypothetical protein RLZZ490_1284 [Cyanobacteriota bacterium]